MLNLDNRLKTVLSIVGKVDLLMDIGCDHGKLIVGAVKNGYAEKGIAVDISEYNLKKTQLFADKKCVSDKISFVCGDGFANISTPVDCVVIAGMGGNEIVNILSRPHTCKRYILVPHQDAVFLRKYLSDNGYFIKKDFVIKENKLYDIIEAVKGGSNYSLGELYLGKNIPESEFYFDKLLHRKAVLDKIVNSYNDNCRSKKLNDDILIELKEIEKCLNLKK